MLEFMFETTRLVTNMILSRMLQRRADVRVIVPHAGAALSSLVNRIELLLPLLTRPGGAPTRSVRDALKTLHFDLADAPSRKLLISLLAVADETKIHCGRLADLSL